jgi:hypothetical protein
MHFALLSGCNRAGFRRPIASGQPRLDPADYVGKHLLLPEIVEEIVIMPVVDLERLVGRARVLMKVLAAPADSRAVVGAGCETG